MHNREKNRVEFSVINFYTIYTLIFPFMGLYSKELYAFALLGGFLNISTFIFYYFKTYSIKRWLHIDGISKKYYMQEIKSNHLFNNVTMGNYVRPYCKYTYTVDGVQYTNDRLSILDKDFLEHESFKDRAYNLLNIDQKTKKITLYYNPKNPKESILIKGISSSKKLTLNLLLIIGVVSMAIGIWNGFFS